MHIYMYIALWLLYFLVNKELRKFFTRNCYDIYQLLSNNKTGKLIHIHVLNYLESMGRAGDGKRVRY